MLQKQKAIDKRVYGNKIRCLNGGNYNGGNIN